MHYKKGVDIASFSNCVLQFKIELLEISPLIWRRILVPSDYNFWDLHVAIQDSMGWFDYHLHYFEIKGKGKKNQAKIGIPDFERMDDPEIFPGWEIPVLNYFNDLGVTAKYLYDFGDSWWHSIQFEGYICKDKKLKYPLCTGGERACPPEDCGGTHGYYEMLKTLADSQNDEYEDMKTWVGKDWNAEKFNMNDVKFDNPYKRWTKAFLEK